MPATFVLRVLDADPTTGTIVGRVTCVRSGREQVVHDVAELTAFVLHELSGDALGDAPTG